MPTQLVDLVTSLQVFFFFFLDRDVKYEMMKEGPHLDVDASSTLSFLLLFHFPLGHYLT